LKPSANLTNSAAHIVANIPKYSYVKPVVQKLHWLPVKLRTHFTVLVTTYKRITGKAPEYLCELLSISWPSRVLRSSSQLLLQMPVSKLIERMH
jgi:hypothetical protein